MPNADPFLEWTDPGEPFLDVAGNANIDASLTTGIVSADITSGNVILGSNSSYSVNVFGGSATLGTGAGQEGFLLGDGSLTLGAAANQVAISPGAGGGIAPAASTVCSTMAASSPHKAQAPIFTPRSATRS